MKNKEILDFIDSFAPFDTQCEWDNSGLLLGNPGDEVYKAGFALDITDESVDDAVLNGCSLIVTHHPVIFHPLSVIGYDSPISKLIKNGISVISAHTNLDNSPLGVNFALSKKLELKNAVKFESDTDASMCFIGETEETESGSFAKFISKALETGVRYTCPGKNIKKVAVCGGAGGEFIGEISKYADAFVTGEIKHHSFSESIHRGFPVFMAGHYETEYPVIPCLCEKTESETGIDCVLLKQSNPCRFAGE